MPAPQWSLGGLLLVVTLIAVCLGLFVNSPGLGILATIAALPALIRTVLLAQQREQLGRPLTTVDKWTAFLGSIGVAMASLTILAVVAAGTFFFVCLRSFNFGSNRHDPNEDRDVLAIILIGSGFTIGAITIIVRWIHKRWRRDTREDFDYRRKE